MAFPTHALKFLRPVIALLLAVTGLCVGAAPGDLLRLTEKLDQMDTQDFQSVMARANRCIRSRDFACADQQLQKAAGLARASGDKDALASARRSVAAEKKEAAQEEAVRVAQAERDRIQAVCEEKCPVSRQYKACVAGTLHDYNCNSRDPDEDRNVAEAAPTYSTADAIRDSLAKTQADYARISGIHNQAMTNIQAQQTERLRQQQAQREREQVQQRQLEARRRADQQERDDARQERDEQRRREQQEQARRTEERLARDKDRERERQQMLAQENAAQDQVKVAVASPRSGNTGRKAMECVSVNREGKDVAFTNTCATPLFVVWCGDMKYTKQRCGDGPAGNGFYTHSNNVKPGETVYARAIGEYRYAACEGGISFGKDEIKDQPDGSFVCIARGKKSES